jgi:hypothetical protein
VAKRRPCSAFIGIILICNLGLGRGEHLTQLALGSVQQYVGCVGLDAKLSRDLAVTQVLKIPQRKSLGLLRRQRSDGLS